MHCCTSSCMSHLAEMCIAIGLIESQLSFKLNEAYPDALASLLHRPSALYSLLGGLHTLVQSESILSLLAANLYLELSVSPQFQMVEGEVDHCGRLLFRLCQLGSPVHRPMVHRYCSVFGLPLPEAFESAWIEDAASDGSYFALETLSTVFPERHTRWKNEHIEHAKLAYTGELRDLRRLLRTYCRCGDYDQCKALLEQGAQAFPDESDEPSVLHWLVSFRDERQLSDLVPRLLANGAALDHWEGDDSDDSFLCGKMSGTPLHWAVWHRNLPLIQLLTAHDPVPEERNVNRAIWLAASLHFYDALEILGSWVALRNPAFFSRECCYSALELASLKGSLHLARMLRHGDESCTAVVPTYDILLRMYQPGPEELGNLITQAVINNDPVLLRYLLKRHNIAGRRDEFNDQMERCFALAILSSFLEVFDVLFECQIFHPHQYFLQSKFTGLQCCVASRQRDTIFMGRFLEAGCPVDGFGDTEESGWPPFAIAVVNGLYDCATLLLEHGADKDCPSGWLGGSSPTFRMLLSWPDIPVSRLVYLLETVPQQGFGHVNFIGWRGAGGNLLYPCAMSAWSHYKASYRLPESMKYILSKMEDKRCLDEMDRMGCTAINMAARSGNLEVCRMLLQAGADPNTGLGIAPLDAAKGWLKKAQAREREAPSCHVIGELRLARTIRIRAEQTMSLLESYGATGRGFIENQRLMLSTIVSGDYKPPSTEVNDFISDRIAICSLFLSRRSCSSSRQHLSIARPWYIPGVSRFNPRKERISASTMALGTRFRVSWQRLDEAWTSQFDKLENSSLLWRVWSIRR